MPMENVPVISLSKACIMQGAIFLNEKFPTYAESLA